MTILAALLALAAQETPVTIRVVDADSGEPVFARVVVRDERGRLVGSCGYRTLEGRFVPPEGWSVPLPPGRYTLHADAGYEFFAHREEWTPAGAGEKRIALRRWVNLRRRGWVAGGDHNHLIREGSHNKNYGGASVTLEFAAAAMASRGWAYFAAGGGGPWVFDGNGSCDARDDNNRTVHAGGRTQAACDAWNQRYGRHCTLAWNNEQIKGRYGHVWLLGRGPLTYPYTDKPADGWWTFYDDPFEKWQTQGRPGPLGPYRSPEWELPPIYDCLKAWRDQGWIGIYAHPTRSFSVGPHRVSNLAASFPFDLLAGAPVGGLAVMGDHYEHPEDQALWFAALNEGFRVPGVAENDTPFGREDIRRDPYVTYTLLPDASGPVDVGEAARAVAAGRNFVSSGAFLLVRADGVLLPGDTAPRGRADHTLEIEAYASADPGDAIERLEIIADGKPVRLIEEARGRREYRGAVPFRAERWAIAKLLGRVRGVAAITNPIYFADPPAPLHATISGRVTLQGKGAPAEIAVSVWGREERRARAAADGTYRLENVPLAARLSFAYEGATASKAPFFDDPEFRALHHRIYTLEFVGAPGALAGGFPPDIFARIRARARAAVLDAELRPREVR
ncbi:MAG TPA: CehA/McbA family metallohydrolase [Planctomycetota bacterium]|jgi:hypothetical protein|nr:CehA/McbA family metallohydrolase [Planctomycetota bacterium]